MIDINGLVQVTNTLIVLVYIQFNTRHWLLVGTVLTSSAVDLRLSFAGTSICIFYDPWPSHHSNIRLNIYLILLQYLNGLATFCGKTWVDLIHNCRVQRLRNLLTLRSFVLLRSSFAWSHNNISFINHLASSSVLFVLLSLSFLASLSGLTGRLTLSYRIV